VTSDTPPPPSPKPSRLRGFWGRRSRKGKILLVVGGLLLALLIIGLAVPAEDSEEPVAQVAGQSVETTEPATTEEATTEEAATEETADEDEDTGRMSEGEFEFFSNALTEVDEEIDQFATTMGRCGVLFQALEVAEGSECVDEAYSGFEDKALLAYAEADDLKDDVAKDCLTALTRYQERLERFATYVGNLHEAGANLQTARFIKISKRARAETARYATARDVALLQCSPV
jgi:hypothetical protein